MITIVKFVWKYFWRLIFIGVVITYLISRYS